MNKAVRDARIVGYTELCKILLEEEIPFKVVDFQDHIYIDPKSELTGEQLLEVFYNRPELRETSSPRTFGVLPADEVFVEVLSSPDDKEHDLRITLLEEP